MAVSGGGHTPPIGAKFDKSPVNHEVVATPGAATTIATLDQIVSKEALGGTLEITKVASVHTGTRRIAPALVKFSVLNTRASAWSDWKRAAWQPGSDLFTKTTDPVTGLGR